MSGADRSRPRRWGVRWSAVLLAAVAAGLGAVALRALLDVTTHGLLGSVLPLEPIGAGLWYAPVEPLRDRGAWLLPLLVAGGMVTAVLLSRLGGPQVNGTDGVINAVNGRDLSGLTVRGALSKLGGTAVTLGSGGSGGTEGPVAQVSASLSAAVGRRLRLTPGESGLVVVAALGAGVGALFQAPIGGVLLAGELLRRRGIDWAAMIFALPAVPIAFWIFVAVYGYRPMFGVADFGALWDPGSTALLAAVGLVCALVARLYVWTFHTVGRLTAPMRRWPVVTAAVAGAALGTVGIFLPMTLGTGYGIVSMGLSQVAVAALPLWLLVALPLVKIAATSVTLHTGGVGGVFGPAMVIGATTGALCWRLAFEAGLQPGSAAAFTITGMAACLGPAVRTPLAAIALALESSGGALPPVGLVVAVAIAAACTRDITLFRSQAERQFPRRYRQLRVSEWRISAILKAVASRKRARVSATIGGIRSRYRARSGSPGGGCAMEPESARGVPDLADLPLDELLSAHRPEVVQAYRTALHRRASVGIIFAGHNAGGA
ncbi:CIC family chloride channel protein [Nocardia mexicana]|uniref:CIC family chloride channel protein n=1 Tax=Nocardia mexicana TaxID=279262 RepID=A0A370H4M4_9NOCA|nr:CIC family chloride channel protein [Nocardia mexicana]